MRTADIDALVPVNTEPIQGLDDCLIGLFGVASGIGIFDAEDQLATSVTGICPVEQGGADEANVRGTGWRRAKAYANI